MKKLSVILILFVASAILVLSPTHASAQCLVTGNVGIQDVNIKIIDTQYGTSSDNNGNFKLLLPKTDRQIGLLFSCIGYQDTLVGVVPQQDTIFIHFKMHEMAYMLDAAHITADRITKYRDYDYVMIDFEIVDDMFFILQRKSKSLKDFRILVTDMVFQPVDTITLPKRFSPTNLDYDIAGNCQIVTQDSMYQIVKADKKYYYAFPSDKKYFNEVMRNILFMTDRYVYFCETKVEGYLMNYYRIDPLEKKREMIFCNDELQKYSEIPQEVRFHELHTARIGEMWIGPSPEQWESFIKYTFLRPDQSYLGHFADTLYYFDHKNRKIDTYNEDLNLLHSCDITYPETESFWRLKIYQDRAWGTFYTIFGTTLNEIDIKTGRTIPKINANNYLSQKMIIYKGNLYSLKKRRDSGNSEVSFIEKTKLY